MAAILSRVTLRAFAVVSFFVPNESPLKANPHRWRRFFWRIAPAGLLVLLAACSPRQMIVESIGDELASQGRAPEDDLVLARDASAFYLKLSESLLREAPG